jgi:hypothetical protein
MEGRNNGFLEVSGYGARAFQIESLQGPCPTQLNPALAMQALKARRSSMN